MPMRVNDPLLQSRLYQPQICRGGLWTIESDGERTVGAAASAGVKERRGRHAPSTS